QNNFLTYTLCVILLFKLKTHFKKVGFFIPKKFYIFAYMSISLNRSLGIQRNKLLRYKLIKELYQKTISEHPHTPLTQIHKQYIFPVYPISRTTLYQVLFTPITSELKNIEDVINSQTKLFS
ncbi:hypothetical protein, partial [Flavobacterium psychrophilum]|uniref:hypothetical protein n=1 Tax=Flavobacterium psychrophilum TaxID=96345 RepID=UPI00211AED93